MRIYDGRNMWGDEVGAQSTSCLADEKEYKRKLNSDVGLEVRPSHEQEGTSSIDLSGESKELPIEIILPRNQTHDTLRANINSCVNHTSMAIFSACDTPLTNYTLRRTCYT